MSTSTDSVFIPKQPMRSRMVISPSRAKEWLKLNKNNRRLDRGHAHLLSVDMKEGRWVYNGDPIRFSHDGVLIDGQHRLFACVTAGVAIEADVIFGLAPSVRETCGVLQKIRTAGEIAYMEGIQNANAACALASLIFIHRHYGVEHFNTPRCKPTKSQVLEVLRDDPSISVIAGKNFGLRGVPQRLYHFCYWLFAQQDEKRACLFFAEISGNADCRINSPAHLLRERLIKNSLAKAKLPFIEWLALFFKAWAAYRDNKAIRTLRWRTGGDSPEEFPSIT